MLEYAQRMQMPEIDKNGIVMETDVQEDVDALVPLYQPWMRLVSISRRAQTLSQSLSKPFVNTVARERRILDTGLALGCQRERAAQLREDVAWTMLLVGKYDLSEMLEQLHFGRMHPLASVMVQRLMDADADPEFALLFPHLVYASGLTAWPTKERFAHLNTLIETAIEKIHKESQEKTRKAVKKLLTF
jgi:hypothetical protein